MLLRRITKRVKAQNWFAVGLDFAIVLLGVTPLLFSQAPSRALTALECGSGEGYQWVPECDVDRMRENAELLNEYVDNLSRINTLVGFVAERRDHLLELKDTLADLTARQGRAPGLK